MWQRLRLCLCSWPRQDETICDSYDTSHWLGFTPLQIKSVTFGDGSTSKEWAVVSDLGGNAEIDATCPSNGGALATALHLALHRHQVAGDIHGRGFCRW